jgi:hypothetical protein
VARQAGAARQAAVSGTHPGVARTFWIVLWLNASVASVVPGVVADTTGAAAGRDDKPARVTVGRTATPVVVDGRLDEPGWAAAGVIADLLQQSPVPGGPTPYRTEVRLLTDGETLYFGVRCDDPDPRRIAIHTMQKDADLTGDDSVTFVLDTFGDQRTAYFLQVNAAAARYDGLIDNQEDISPDWDGIWSAAVVRDAGGWTLEVAIPSHTLRFTPGAAAWGFNVQRYVARDRTTLRWSGTTLDAQLTDMRRAGVLDPVGGLSQGIGLSISPYGLVRRVEDFVAGDVDTTGEAGVDVAYGLSDQLSGVLTVNTDFAETEVDTRQINLTRFPLFFPEKRYFFVEGANQFAFGTGPGTDFVPFFSRRVGLFADERVPIDIGAKIIGRQGRWGIGLLDVMTGDATVAPATNMFAGRVTYDVTGHLRAGAIGTRGDPDGVSDNWLGGLDLLWQTSTFRGEKNLSIGGWWSKTGGDPPTGNPGGRSDGSGFKVEYANDRWYDLFAFRSFGESLNPAMGFLPRPGVRIYDTGLAFKPRPQSGWWAGKVRQFFFEIFPYYVTDHSGTTETWEVFAAPFNVETPAGAHLEADWDPQFERLDAPFEVSPGVIIPVGAYHFTRYRAEASSQPDRPWTVHFIGRFGGFYSGQLTSTELTAGYAARGGRLQISVDGLHVQGTLPEGDFITRLWQLKTSYAVSPDLVFSVYGQYDSDSHNLGVNSRMRWTIQPGADLYVVWTRGWLHPPDADRWSDAEPQSDEAIVKLRWTFRM